LLFTAINHTFIHLFYLPSSMDDPLTSWPFWKFGLKKDDLFTKLHDQYNTFPSSIQDPEAFHHDVFECSQEACTPEEFHRLLASRKEQRLRELNSSLESASLEIIANPSLVGTEQWQYALQLFRTKSLDSLVRYFSSYLPDSHPWHESESDAFAGFDDDHNVKSSIHSDETSFFDDMDEKLMVTHEPLSISDDIHSHLPPSPRSMTMCSQASADALHHTYIMNNLTPARTLSFSESESDRFTFPSGREGSDHLHDDDLSQPDDPETPISEYSEGFPETADFEMSGKDDGIITEPRQEIADEPASQMSTDIEYETPTPKPENHGTVFFDAKPSPARRRGCSFSPSRPHPLAQVHSPIPDHELAKSATARFRRRDHSPGRRRKSPGQSTSRIQKSLPGPARSKQRGRRRLEEC
jgi:hypothetical protein